MSLINCSECNHEVSDKAESCPKCGLPISNAKETLAAGTQINTIQETSKKFKMQTLISVSMIIIGFVWLFNNDSTHATIKDIPAILIWTGLIWYLVNRIRIWWHHK